MASAPLDPVKSTGFFNRMKGLIGVASKEELETVVQEPRKQHSQIRVPGWNHFRLNLGVLSAIDKIASTP
jgi:hypothetical protein